MDINKILRNGEVESKLPNVLQNDETPSVVYIMSTKSHNKLLNYIDSVSNINAYDLQTFGTGLRD